MLYVENPNWSATCIVPKDNEFVDIIIELWDQSTGLCDISPDSGNVTQAQTVELTYSIATGIWWGDDTLGDPSGYGRLNGCDDGTIYQQDRDCELFFNITQTDFDGDNLPYWLEVNMYNTSPLINNRGEDTDQDSIPIEWEYKFGVTFLSENNHSGYYLTYDPNKKENHTTVDPDRDGLTNREEYMTSQWNSDPFRKDIFIEIDQMAIGPNGEGSIVPTQAYDFIRDAHARHNIVWHIDDGRLGGGEIIPFKATTDNSDPETWYSQYFLHGDTKNWRRGVFHYCIVAYDYTWAPGFMFDRDAVFLSTKYHDLRAKLFPLFDDLNLKKYTLEIDRAYVYGGGIMHETGHTLGLRGDIRKTVWPWQVNYWIFANYISCMNYRYVYRGIVDYSDGSHGTHDVNDWGTIDLTRFNPR
jgi:hypothetical protein